MTRISLWQVLSQCKTEERFMEGIGGYKGWSVPWEASGPVVLNSVHMSASPSSGWLGPHTETPVLLDSGTPRVVVVLLFLLSPPPPFYKLDFLKIYFSFVFNVSQHPGVL